MTLLSDALEESHHRLSSGLALAHNAHMRRNSFFQGRRYSFRAGHDTKMYGMRDSIIGKEQRRRCSAVPALAVVKLTMQHVNTVAPRGYGHGEWCIHPKGGVSNNAPARIFGEACCRGERTVCRHVNNAVFEACTRASVQLRDSVHFGIVWRRINDDLKSLTLYQRRELIGRSTERMSAGDEMLPCIQGASSRDNHSGLTQDHENLGTLHSIKECLMDIRLDRFRNRRG